MKNLKVNESSGNGDIIIFSLLPDDYHGSPEITDIFPSKSPGGNFPMIPSEGEVFSAWSAAGYNSYQMGGSGEDDEDGEEEYGMFQQFGNMEIYYAVYLITIDDSSKRDRILSDIRDQAEEEVYANTDGDAKMSQDDFIKMLKGIDGITSAIVLMKP